MTREQAKKNLIALGVAEPTDEQVTNYLNQHNGEVRSIRKMQISGRRKLIRQRSSKSSWMRLGSRTLRKLKKNRRQGRQQNKGQQIYRSSLPRWRLKGFCKS